MSAATSYRTEQASILGRLADEWLDEVDPTEPRTQIAWPNTKYPPADDYAENPEKYDGQPYIEPVVNRQTAFNAAFTAKDKLIRHPGLLTINVRTPINEGGGAAFDLADEAAALFRNRTFDGITFRAPTVRPFGPEGPWYRVQVDCPYWRDSIHTHA